MSHSNTAGNDGIISFRGVQPALVVFMPLSENGGGQQ